MQERLYSSGAPRAEDEVDRLESFIGMDDILLQARRLGDRQWIVRYGGRAFQLKPDEIAEAERLRVARRKREADQLNSVRAAERTIRSLLRDPGPPRAILFAISRDFTARQSARFRPLAAKPFIGCLTPETDIASLLTEPGWEESVDAIARAVEKAGMAIERLSQSATDSGDWAYIAAALDLPDETGATPRPVVADNRAAASPRSSVERLLTGTRVVQYVARSIFDQHVEAGLPQAPSRSVLARHVRSGFAKFSWTEAVDELRGETLSALDALRRVSAARGLTMSVSGKPYWYGAALFLLIWYGPGAQVEPHVMPITNLRDLWHRWFPQPISSIENRPKSSTPFDPSYAMDPYFRSRARGETFKPGSWGEGRHR